MNDETIWNNKNEINIGRSKIKAINFADDQALWFLDQPKGLQEMAIKINRTAKKYNLKMFVNKTKPMVIVILQRYSL